MKKLTSALTRVRAARFFPTNDQAVHARAWLARAFLPEEGLEFVSPIRVEIHAYSPERTIGNRYLNERGYYFVSERPCPAEATAPGFIRIFSANSWQQCS
jgi:hypothetical protein